MKTALTTFLAIATITATPALAHPGTHLHPHANDPSWLPIMVSGLIIATAALAWARMK